MHLKLFQKEQFKKKQKQVLIFLLINLLIELRKLQKLQKKIIETQLKMRMIKKNLKKNRYLQNKDRKFLVTFLGYFWTYC